MIFSKDGDVRVSQKQLELVKSASKFAIAALMGIISFVAAGSKTLGSVIGYVEARYVTKEDFSHAVAERNLMIQNLNNGLAANTQAIRDQNDTIRDQGKKIDRVYQIMIERAAIGLPAPRFSAIPRRRSFE